MHRAAAQRFAASWGDVEALATKYRDRRWMAALPETQIWAGTILGMGLDKARVVMPAMLESFVDLFYDSVSTLPSLSIPMR